MKIDAIHPVFVVGVGRSGTSLIQSILASHSALAFPPETSFLRRLVVSGKLKSAIDNGCESSLLSNDAWISRTNLDVQKILSLAKQEDEFTAGAVYRSLLKLNAQTQNKRSFGDKDPRGIEFLDLINLVLPNINLVLIIRDPRDVLVSKKTARWSKENSVLRHIFANRIQIKLGRKKGKKLFGDRYHEISYEGLLRNPEGELGDLCNALGIGYEPTMLDFAGAAKKLVSDEEIEWKKETFGPLLRNNQGKWVCELSDYEIALTEKLCREQFNVCGYVASNRFSQLPLLKKIRVYFTVIVIALIEPAYCGYRAWTIWRAIRFL